MSENETTEAEARADRLLRLHAHARVTLDNAARVEPIEFVRTLTQAREAVDAVLSEAMAQAVTSGHSARQVADAAGIAPNSVSTRLARSASLSGYADDGRVRASGVARARHDAGIQLGVPSSTTGAQPMRFTPRRSTTTDAQEG